VTVLTHFDAVCLLILSKDAAVGVLQIHIDSARQLKAVKLGGGIPDPYVAISINNRKVLDKTKFRPSTYVDIVTLLVSRLIL
jgi:Ca2+-dependent lipid-binding protein